MYNKAHADWRSLASAVECSDWIRPLEPSHLAAGNLESRLSTSETNAALLHTLAAASRIRCSDWHRCHRPQTRAHTAAKGLNLTGYVDRGEGSNAMSADRPHPFIWKLGCIRVDTHACTCVSSGADVSAENGSAIRTRIRSWEDETSMENENPCLPNH